MVLPEKDPCVGSPQTHGSFSGFKGVPRAQKKTWPDMGTGSAFIIETGTHVNKCVTSPGPHDSWKSPRRSSKDPILSQNVAKTWPRDLHFTNGTPSIHPGDISGSCNRGA